MAAELVVVCSQAPRRTRLSLSSSQDILAPNAVCGCTSCSAMIDKKYFLIARAFCVQNGAESERAATDKRAAAQYDKNKRSRSCCIIRQKPGLTNFVDGASPLLGSGRAIPLGPFVRLVGPAYAAVEGRMSCIWSPESSWEE